MFAQRARDNLACVAFCGLVGGQDELVFDGHSLVVDHTGQTIARGAQFREELLVCDVDLDAAEPRLRGRHPPRAITVACPLLADPRWVRASLRRPQRAVRAELPEEAEVYAALMLGLRDYVDKNGFDHVVLGLSGGSTPRWWPAWRRMPWAPSG